MLVAGCALVAGAVSLGSNVYKRWQTKQKTRAFLVPAPPPVFPAPCPALVASPDETPALIESHLGALNPNHYIAAGATAMGLSTAGALFFPPIRLLSVPLILYTAMPLFRASYQALRYERRVKAVMLDATAVLGALAARYYFLSGLECCIFFTGQKLLQKTRDTSRKQLRNMLGELPRAVWVLRDGVEVQIPYDRLSVGDVLVVNAGETVPVDGVITAGCASMDQRMLTGEAQPADKGVGDTVLATTIVLSGRLHIQVDKAGTETAAAHIEDILARTTEFQSTQQTRVETLADRAVLPTLGLSAVALSLLGRVSAVAVLSANYMDAARVASPLSMLNFVTLAAQRGILIKDGRALETLQRVDTVVFDKTGTLTLEQPHVGEIVTYNGWSTADVLRYAAAAELHQTHPIARAIVEAAAAQGVTLPSVDEAQYTVGYGITVHIAGRCVRVGSARFLTQEGVPLPAEIETVQHTSAVHGHSLVFVALDQQLGGVLTLQATIRPEAPRIVRQLRRRHLELYLLSGDHLHPTTQLATTLGIEHVFAETLPDEKAALIARLQQEGRTVCFIGDGINDAIALQQADVSISLQGASAIATDTAQLILMDQSLNQLADLFDVAEQFRTHMKINLAAVLVPGLLCVGGVFVFHLGIFAASMFYNVSVVTGVGNAMRPWVRRSWETRHAPPRLGHDAPPALPTSTT